VRAFRLAEELGSIPAAARQLGASRPALRAGWQRFGLGTPDTARARQQRQAPRVARLDGAFLALNPITTLKVRAVGPAGLAARVRRAEREATLGYRVTTELTAENHWRSVSLRAWAVGQRARGAQQRAHAHARERSPDRSRSTPERSPARPGRQRDGDQDADRPGERDRCGGERKPSTTQAPARTGRGLLPSRVSTEVSGMPSTLPSCKPPRPARPVHPSTCPPGCPGRSARDRPAGHPSVHAGQPSPPAGLQWTSGCPLACAGVSEQPRDPGRSEQRSSRWLWRCQRRLWRCQRRSARRPGPS
jgi:hypothetical protein